MVSSEITNRSKERDKGMCSLEGAIFAKVDSWEKAGEKRLG
jgi:hypothetical protein